MVFEQWSDNQLQDYIRGKGSDPAVLPTRDALVAEAMRLSPLAAQGAQFSTQPAAGQHVRLGSSTVCATGSTSLQAQPWHQQSSGGDGGWPTPAQNSYSTQETVTSSYAQQPPADNSKPTGEQQYWATHASASHASAPMSHGSHQRWPTPAQNSYSTQETVTSSCAQQPPAGNSKPTGEQQYWATYASASHASAPISHGSHQRISSCSGQGMPGAMQGFTGDAGPTAAGPGQAALPSTSGSSYLNGAAPQGQEGRNAVPWAGGQPQDAWGAARQQVAPPAAVALQGTPWHTAAVAEHPPWHTAAVAAHPPWLAQPPPAGSASVLPPAGSPSIPPPWHRHVSPPAALADAPAWTGQQPPAATPRWDAMAARAGAAEQAHHRVQACSPSAPSWDAPWPSAPATQQAPAGSYGGLWPGLHPAPPPAQHAGKYSPQPPAHQPGQYCPQPATTYAAQPPAAHASGSSVPPAQQPGQYWPQQATAYAAPPPAAQANGSGVPPQAHGSGSASPAPAGAANVSPPAPFAAPPTSMYGEQYPRGSFGAAPAPPGAPLAPPSPAHGSHVPPSPARGSHVPHSPAHGSHVPPGGHLSGQPPAPPVLPPSVLQQSYSPLQQGAAAYAWQPPIAMQPRGGQPPGVQSSGGAGAQHVNGTAAAAGGVPYPAPSGPPAHMQPPYPSAQLHGGSGGQWPAGNAHAAQPPSSTAMASATSSAWPLPTAPQLGDRGGGDQDSGADVAGRMRTAHEAAAHDRGGLHDGSATHQTGTGQPPANAGPPGVALAGDANAPPWHPHAGQPAGSRGVHGWNGWVPSGHAMPYASAGTGFAPPPAAAMPSHASPAAAGAAADADAAQQQQQHYAAYFAGYYVPPAGGDSTWRAASGAPATAPGAAPGYRHAGHGDSGQPHLPAGIPHNARFPQSAGTKPYAYAGAGGTGFPGGYNGGPSSCYDHTAPLPPYSTAAPTYGFATAPYGQAVQGQQFSYGGYASSGRDGSAAP